MGFEEIKRISDAEDWQMLVNKMDEVEDSHRIKLFGNLLLRLVKTAHEMGIDAESALRNALTIFREQFAKVEAAVKASGIGISDLSNEEIKQMWLESVKIEENNEEK
jgi:uncharacterized protein YabN with tetrapyrrole methylase and pyrophosphatase domain